MALILMVAPLACKKEEPIDETVVADGSTKDQTTDQAGDPPPATDNDLAPAAETLDGSWRSVGADDCTQVDFDLTNPSQQDAGTAVFYRSPGEGLPLHDLQTLLGTDLESGLGVGLTGTAQSGGPFADCGEPRRTTFTTTLKTEESLAIHWICTAGGGVGEREATVLYERGACPGGTFLIPETRKPDTPTVAGTETPPNGGPGGTSGGTSSDGTGETAVGEGSTTGATTGCTMAGTWRQSTVDIGATSWDITASGQATETGIGYAKGTATLTGQTLRIDWTTTNGYAGTYQWTLDSDCKSGSGNLVFSAGRTGTFDSIVTR